ncbi:hypothetical protein H5410_021410 [Solanum commersonii]|uniref:Uncharacterized protein n=1 Tax=Solanum commersonii TaxID=4109 RepID=A0A9J5ZBA8_SOLCO|nr:hypothetical protein H5410_021410 [Solanum commersonii]
MFLLQILKRAIRKTKRTPPIDTNSPARVEIVFEYDKNMIRASELEDNRAYLHFFVSFFNSFTILFLPPMVTVLCKVLCARPALDRSLPREQVNLTDCEMNSQEKRQLQHIIDPDLLGEVRLDSFRKFGETTMKCIAESGADIPSIGVALWNLEYALHLQEPIIQENSTIPIGELSLKINDFSHIGTCSNAARSGTSKTSTILLPPMVIILCEVLCPRPALDRSLTREQEKRQLDHIIDPDLLGEVSPDSIRKFGETTVKYLAESGVDRPSLGEVLRNLEHALHVQEPIIQENSTIPKKQKFNNLNSKLNKLSIGKTTEKKNFSNYSVPTLSSKCLGFCVY